MNRQVMRAEMENVKVLKGAADKITASQRVNYPKQTREIERAYITARFNFREKYPEIRLTF